MVSGKYKINLAIKTLFLAIAIVILSSNAVSHEEEAEIAHQDLDDAIREKSIHYITTITMIIAVLVALSLYFKEKDNNLKWILFLAISVQIIIVTFYLSYSTIYLNFVSETKGPVHWHADFEVWSCGKKIDLVDPKGFSNKVGSPVLHEHNDDRIHVEGVVLKKSDVDLHNFFDKTGGYLSNNALAIPVDKGIVQVENDDLCGQEKGTLQVFLLKVKNPEDAKNWVFEQVKLEDFGNHILSPYSQVPPGDCIIIEFAPDKERTEHICESYNVAIKKGDLIGS